MSRLVPEDRLPAELSAFSAVEAAYPEELARASEALVRGLPVLVECDKGLTPFFYKCLRDRLKRDGLACAYLDGRAPEPPPGASMGPQPSIVGTMIAQLRDAVRGAVDRRVAVLPHLDLLTSSTGGLTTEAREVIPLLYENPNLLWLGFRDPSFPIPSVIRDLFPQRISILGVGRDRLPQLVTRREARKLGASGLDVYRLYKHVSGVHAVKLRRLLEALRGEDYPTDPRAAWDQLRRATLEADLSIPDLDLERDIGGYAPLKKRIREEILDVVRYKESLDDADAIARVESLVPRGIIFWGPPGTGKTLFAKAIASALGAAVQVVAGPELKSRWVGESEENLRRLFVQARQSAPSLIVFDELDSFASARGTYTGSGVEHSMVNQLLTEMDGFRANEMVFVVGTTNFVESLDPALMRPGRFELALHVPYPGADDRRAILRVHDRRLGLSMTDDALEHAVRQSAYPLDEGGSRWSGDHLQALCRTIARRRVKKGSSASTEVADVDEALAASSDRPALTPLEERVVATHEAGHAVVALSCPHVPAIERISIRGDLAGALGFVSYADPAHRYVVTRGQLLDAICVLFGGREAELALCDDLSIGSSHDLARATQLARALVERYGMGPDGVGVRDFGEEAGASLSDRTRAAVDEGVAQILGEQRERARAIIDAHRAHVVALRDLLVEQKVLDARAAGALLGEAREGDG